MRSRAAVIAGASLALITSHAVRGADLTIDPVLFMKRELHTPLLGGFGEKFAVSGRGIWSEDHLDILWSKQPTPPVVAKALERLGTFCTQHGGGWRQAISPASRRHEHEGVYSCEADGDIAFEVDVSANAQVSTPASPWYVLTPAQGKYEAARARWIARDGEAQNRARAAKAEAERDLQRIEAFRTSLNIGSEGRLHGAPVLVVEVKKPLVLVQLEGHGIAAQWVRISELYPR